MAKLSVHRELKTGSHAIMLLPNKKLLDWGRLKITPEKKDATKFGGDIPLKIIGLAGLHALSNSFLIALPSVSTVYGFLMYWPAPNLRASFTRSVSENPLTMIIFWQGAKLSICL